MEAPFVSPHPHTGPPSTQQFRLLGAELGFLAGTQTFSHYFPANAFNAAKSADIVAFKLWL